MPKKNLETLSTLGVFKSLHVHFTGILPTGIFFFFFFARAWLNVSILLVHVKRLAV